MFQCKTRLAKMLDEFGRGGGGIYNGCKKMKLGHM